MPASTSDTAARLLSSTVVSIFSDAMAFIGRSLFRVDEAKRGCPPHDDQVSRAIHPADFDDIAAGLRQCAAGLRAEARKNHPGRPGECRDPYAVSFPLKRCCCNTEQPPPRP